MSVVIETTIGDITVDLYVKERPNTCLNFLKLCKVKFYNLCIFHKIEKNFIAQTGDPTATGRGGESIFCRLYGDQAKYFDAEFKPLLKHKKLGTLSMVNNGNNMNGSQFFITLNENLTYLDENHSVFGEVAEGFDVLLKLNDAICDNNNRPYQDIRITHTVILHDPFDDPKGLEIPDASPEPTKAMLESDYIAPDEEIDDTKGKTAEEIEEKIKESEAKARATILEMVGDIPDAEVKPPENVLFVCKLNPVTTSEDLEVIFSRFGKILSCEVIKDKKTGESLQYAFIEFEREEDCEAAYFKMDNVLIDDRRIHVDFSQSVSKLYFNRDKLPTGKQFRSNLKLKNSDKNDGYDLIFDDDKDNSVKRTSHKSKSYDPTSKYKSSSKKRKHSSSSDDLEERKSERKETNYSDRNYKDARKYTSEKERSKYREEQQRSRERDYSHSSNKRESDKNKNYRSREDYYNYDEKSREYKQNRNEKYDRKYENKAYTYSSDNRREPDYKSKSKYSSDSIARSDKNSKDYKKLPQESYSEEYKRERKNYPSSHPKKSFKSREYSHEYPSRRKHSDASDSEEYVAKIKVVEKAEHKSSPYKQKKNKGGKHFSSKKVKSRSASVSSSSSSSSSSSTSTSSSSVSVSSSSSSHSKSKRKHHEKDKKHQSKKKRKSVKKRKQ